MTGSTVSFAFVASTVATVNPCGFALLPTYLARRVGVEDGARPSADAVSRALLVGGVTTAGFMLVFGTIGTAIGLGARELTRALPWAGLVIGVALVLAGAAVLAGAHLRLRLPQLRYRGAGESLRGDVLFGVGYGTASLSCTLPIFLAATGSAVTGSLAGSALSFIAYAAGMGTVLTALAVAATLSQQAFDQHLAARNQSCTLAVLRESVERFSGLRLRRRRSATAKRERPSDQLWRVAATLRFEADDERYAWLTGRLGVWEGEFDAEAHRAHYHAFLTPDPTVPRAAT